MKSPFLMAVAENMRMKNYAEKTKSLDNITKIQLISDK